MAIPDLCPKCGAALTPHDGGEYGLHDYYCPDGPWPTRADVERDWIEQGETGPVPNPSAFMRGGGG